jgi:hypothetical protein
MESDFAGAQGQGETCLLREEGSSAPGNYQGNCIKGRQLFHSFTKSSEELDSGQ